MASAPAPDQGPSPGRPSASLHFIVGKIDGKLDQMLLMFAGTEERVDKLSGRVGKLEAWQSRIIGGGAALTLLVTASEIIRYVAPHTAR